MSKSEETIAYVCVLVFCPSFPRCRIVWLPFSFLWWLTLASYQVGAFYIFPLHVLSHMGDVCVGCVVDLFRCFRTLLNLQCRCLNVAN